MKITTVYLQYKWRKWQNLKISESHFLHSVMDWLTDGRTVIRTDKVNYRAASLLYKEKKEKKQKEGKISNQLNFESVINNFLNIEANFNIKFYGAQQRLDFQWHTKISKIFLSLFLYLIINKWI